MYAIVQYYFASVMTCAHYAVQVVIVLMIIVASVCLSICDDQ